MSEEINVYCDESCHLENDGHSVMVLGAIWCKREIVQSINKEVRQLKESHNLNKHLEIKWTKVSPAGAAFYLTLVRYFFEKQALHFRGLVALHKEDLDHSSFSQTHDIWYHKMYFDLLKLIIEPKYRYNIYIDIKDTKSAEKIRKLHEVLSNNIYDFSREIISKIQTVHSREVEILQLTDLFTGSLSYLHRGLEGNQAKLALIDEIKRRSHYSLKLTTLAREPKFNLLIWTPQPTEAEQ